MLRISILFIVALFSLNSFSSNSKEYSLQTWSCAEKNNLLNPELKNLKSIKIFETETQRIVTLNIYNSGQVSTVLIHELKNWNQTSTQLAGWSQDSTYMYHFTIEFNSNGKAEKVKVYTTYIHFDGDDVCVGDLEI